MGSAKSLETQSFGNLNDLRIRNPGASHPRFYVVRVEARGGDLGFGRSASLSIRCCEHNLSPVSSVVCELLDGPPWVVSELHETQCGHHVEVMNVDFVE